MKRITPGITLSDLKHPKKANFYNSPAVSSANKYGNTSA